MNLFTIVFSGLSSGFQILNVLCKQILRNICRHYQIFERTEMQSDQFLASALLKANQALFFNNLIARLRYTQNKHLLLSLKSLRNLAPKLLIEVIKDLFEVVQDNIDQALIKDEQKDMLLSLEILNELT